MSDMTCVHRWCAIVHALRASWNAGACVCACVYVSVCVSACIRGLRFAHKHK